MNTPLIAIVGRPNVGKSTLFNRMVGQRQALVDDRPGVTRDRQYGVARWLDREFRVVDTGGFEPDLAALEDGDLFRMVRRQAEIAISEADLVLFVVDRQVGLAPADRLTAEILRKNLGGAQGRIVLIVNKCDGPRHDDESVEFYELGIDPMLCLSAEHGRGIYELWAEVERRFPESAAGAGEDDGAAFDLGDEDDAGFDGEALSDEELDALAWADDDGDGGPPEDGPEGSPREAPTPDEIRVAILGRPNIGKSTLINRILGEERHVVHDSPGTTMDAVDSVVEIGGQRWRLVDTAGIRRRARIEDPLETWATLRAIKTIERCHVTLLMIDAAEGVSVQDARLAQLIVERGRACVLLLNRWDLVREDPERNVHVVDDELEQALPHLHWAPRLYISALTGKGCHRILHEVWDAFRAFDRRVSTARLNQWLRETVAANAPPQRYHHPVRLNYITQTRVRPPSFVVWSNTPEGVKEGYRRYLENRLRDAWGFSGTPIRLRVRRKRKPGEAKVAHEGVR
jgi:GTP-binding protein